MVLNDNWTESYKNKGSYYCNNCINIEAKILRLENKSLIQNGYGNICNCCGESGWKFLTIDHIFNDGALERKNITASIMKRKIIDDNFPKDKYQLLCINCNLCKGSNGFCAHNLKNKGENCIFCNVFLNDDNMFNINKKYNHSICSTCCLTVERNNYTKKEFDVKSFHNKNHILRLRGEIIDNYGGKCECCGEDEFYFLTIDHVYGRTNTEIYKDKKSVKSPYSWAKRNNYPKDIFKLLCYNCNCSQGYYENKKCYHELNREHGKIITIEDYKQLVMNNLV